MIFKDYKKPDSRNLVDKYKYKSVEDIRKDMSVHSFPFHVAIENFQHDFNIGSIVRSANAFNASGVHIIGKRHWNRRGAMSTEKYLNLYHHKDVSDFLNYCEQNSLSVIGIDNIPGSVYLHKITLPKKCVLVFGQEGPGLSKQMISNCEYVVAIKQYGSTRSINVGASAGAVLYEWTRQHKAG